MNQNIDSEQARQQLDTLNHLRRRVHKRIDSPTLLIFALGLFLTLALHQSGKSPGSNALSIMVFPVLIPLLLMRQPAKSRLSLGDGILAVFLLLFLLLLFISFGYWNPFGWAFVWPVAGLLAALPLVIAAWSQRR